MKTVPIPARRPPFVPSRLAFAAGLSLLALASAVQAQETPAAPSSAADTATTLKPITIKGARQAEAAPVVGKTGDSLKETPQSVTVLTPERIEQQAIRTLDDAMMQTTGVTREQLWLSNNYYVRGIKVENVRYDGGATSVITDRNNNADVAQFEQISILRGADGLFGANDVGGVINLRSKRPKGVFEAEGQLTLGRWNTVRAEVDVTGPLMADSDVLKGRAVAVFEDKDLFHEPSHSRREVLYGALQADISTDTVIFGGVSYQRDRQDAFNASLMRYVDGADPGFPRSTTMGAPWGWLNRENVALWANLDQRLGGSWKLAGSLRYTDGNDRINGAEMEGAISYTTLTSDWWRYQDRTRARELLGDVNVQGSFEAFGQAHDVLVGIDTVRGKKDYQQNWTFYGPGNAFDRVAPPEWAYPQEPWESDRVDKAQRSSVYGSLRLRPVDRLSVIGGVRYAFEDKQQVLNRTSGLTNDYSQDNDPTPYYAVVFDVTPQVSVYASRAEVYKSQLNYKTSLDNPESLDPATGRNDEIGVKASLLDGRVNASLAWFDIHKDGEAVSVNWTPTGSNAWCCYTASGAKRSQGVDLEVTGRVPAGWDLNFGYTYNDNSNTRSNDTRFSTVTPRHLLKVWSYHDAGVWLPGLSLGWGVNAQSESYQQGSVRSYNAATGEFDGPWQDYRFSQGGYAVWSARAAYEFDRRWSVAVNVGNLFDKTYYSTVGQSGYGNFYGEPRNVQVTLKAKY